MNPEILDRLPPHDPQAELACVGSVLLDPSKIDAVASLVKPGDFYSTAANTLLGHLYAAQNRNERIDAVTIANRITSAGDMGLVGGEAGIADFMQSTGVAAHAEYYAGIVAEDAKRRRLILSAGELMRSAYDGEIKPSESASKYADELTEIGASGHATSTVDVMEVVGDIITDLDSGRSRLGLPTGLYDFDNEIGGLRGGELIILAARPRMGKTTLALNIMKTLVYTNRNVLFVSLEMTAMQLLERVLCSIAEVDGNLIRTDKLSEMGKSAMADAASTLPWDNIHIPETTTATTADIRWLARKIQPDLIVVDYLQLIKPSSEKANRNEAVGQMSNDLKRLTLELNLPVLCLSQLNRQVEQKGRHVPGLGSLRECLASDNTLLFTSGGVRCNMDSRMSLYALNNSEVTVMETENVKKRRSPTILVRLRSGRYLQCTKKHKVLTDRGWVEAAKLTIDHAIACAHILEPPPEAVTIPHARWMGWMLGNGSMIGLRSPSFICSDERLAKDFIKATKSLFGLTPRWHEHWCGNVYQYDITKGYYSSKPNECKTWLKESGMWGKRAPEKSIPEWFLHQADNASIAEIVGGMMDTDGSVPQMNTGRGCVQYTTTSKVMAYQFIWCLARLGVYGRVDDGYMSDKATTPLYKIRIDDGVEVQKFRDAVRLTGVKGRKLARAKLSTRGSNHGNRLGEWAGAELVAHAKRQGINSTQLGYRDQGKRIGREHLRRLLDTLEEENDKLRWLTNPNIYWDRLRDISPGPVVQVFDRHVPDCHNFVANGIIVHNSGNIEQDADIVMFLHREEVYSKSTDDAGKAELIVAKNRNGPEAEIKLEWDSATTTFRNNEPDTNWNPNWSE